MTHGLETVPKSASYYMMVITVFHLCLGYLAVQTPMTKEWHYNRMTQYCLDTNLRLIFLFILTMLLSSKRGLHTHNFQFHDLQRLFKGLTDLGLEQRLEQILNRGNLLRKSSTGRKMYTSP